VPSEEMTDGWIDNLTAQRLYSVQSRHERFNLHIRQCYHVPSTVTAAASLCSTSRPSKSMYTNCTLDKHHEHVQNNVQQRAHHCCEVQFQY